MINRRYRPVIPSLVTLALQGQPEQPFVSGRFEQPAKQLRFYGQVCEVRVMLTVDPLHAGDSCRVEMFDWTKESWRSLEGEEIDARRSLWRATIQAGNVGGNNRCTRLRIAHQRLPKETEVTAAVNLRLVPPIKGGEGPRWDSLVS